MLRSEGQAPGQDQEQQDRKDACQTSFHGRGTHFRVFFNVVQQQRVVHSGLLRTAVHTALQQPLHAQQVGVVLGFERLLHHVEDARRVITRNRSGIGRRMAVRRARGSVAEVVAQGVVLVQARRNGNRVGSKPISSPGLPRRNSSPERLPCRHISARRPCRSSAGIRAGSSSARR